MIDLNDAALRVFDALAYIGEHHSLAATAKKFNCSTPTLTTQIEYLERQTGLSLVNKGKGDKITSLTKEGELFVAETQEPIRRMLRNVGYIQPSESKGIVRLYASDILANDILLNEVRQWEQRAPNIVLHVSIATAKNASDALINGDADFSLIFGRKKHWDKGIHALFEMDCPMVAVVASKHELFGRKENITAKELTRYKLALPPDHFFVRKYFDELLEGEGEPKSVPAFQANSTAFLKNYILHKPDPPISVLDRRVAVLPCFAVWKEVQDGSLTAISIAGAQALNTCFCLGVLLSRWHSPDDKKLLKDVAEYLENAFKKLEARAKAGLPSIQETIPNPNAS